MQKQWTLLKFIGAYKMAQLPKKTRWFNKRLVDFHQWEGRQPSIFQTPSPRVTFPALKTPNGSRETPPKKRFLKKIDLKLLLSKKRFLMEQKSESIELWRISYANIQVSYLSTGDHRISERELHITPSSWWNPTPSFNPGKSSSNYESMPWDNLESV